MYYRRHIHGLMLYYVYIILYTNEGKKPTSRLIRGLNGTRRGIPCNKLYKLPMYNVYILRTLYVETRNRTCEDTAAAAAAAIVKVSGSGFLIFFFAQQYNDAFFSSFFFTNEEYPIAGI